jgi:putative endonuclease
MDDLPLFFNPRAVSLRMAGPMKTLWLNLERAVLRQLDSFGARFGPARHTPTHLRTGQRGEMEALFHLRHNGYTIAARRWRCTEERGDLDLVGWEPCSPFQPATLCFIEVKTRTARDLSPPESSVDREKQHHLRAMASAFVRRMPRDQRHSTPIRFDIVSVYLLRAGVECELLRNAFPYRTPARSKRLSK